MHDRRHSRTAPFARAVQTFAVATRGAIDLASILVGVLVLGVLGGVITAALFTVLPWAQNQGASAAASGVRVAEALAFNRYGKYLDYDGLLAKGFIEPSDNIGAITDATGKCYVTGSKSASGTTFYATNKSGTILDNTAGTPDTSWCVDATWSSNTGLTNLATNPSGEGSAGPAVERTNYALDPSAASSVGNFGQSGASPATTTQSIATDKPHHGTTSLKRVLTADGATGNAARISPNTMRVNAGEKFSWTFWVFSTRAANINPYCDGAKVSDLTYIGASSAVVAVPANAWTKVTASATPSVDMFANQCGGYNMALLTGDSVWFDEFLIERAPSPWTYFDGGTASAGDLTYAWSGAANASASTMSTPDATTFSTGSPGKNLVYRAAAVLGTGTRSVKGVSNGTDIRVSANTALFPVTAGKTYTMMATFKMSRAGVNVYLEGGTAFEHKVALLSNGAAQKLRVSFTSATTGNSRFQIAALSGNNPGDFILVDDILFVEGDYTGSYFDGSSPSASWAGTAHASVSNGYRG